MARFEIQTPKGRFEVQAPDMETALRVLSGKPQDQSHHREFDGSNVPGYNPETGMVEKTTAGDAFGLGAADVASWGLGDEFGASAASGSLFGLNDGLWGDYDKTLGQMRARQSRAAEEHPVANMAGSVAGALTGGVGLAKSGLTFAGKLGAKAGTGARMAALAKDGAVFGGGYGFGSGEGVADRLTDAAGGATMGALIGAAVPGLVAGTKAATRPLRDAVRARTDPGGYASQKLAERLSASNMTPETVARKMAANPGSSVADVGGKSTRDLLRTTVNVPGPAKDRVAKQVTLRQFGQGDRLKDAIGRTFADPDGYLNAKDELAQAAQAQAAPLYERAYARPVHFSQTLEDILKTPAGQRALSQAQRLAANEQQPFRQIFININGQAKRVPDTRGWDYIKRAMDDMIEGQKDPITGKVTNEGRILIGLKERMLKEVDAFNPDYRKARQVFGGVAQVERALEFGRTSASMSPEAIRRAMAKMTPAEKEAARIGRAENLRLLIDKAGVTNNAILKIFSNRQNIEGLRAMFDSPTQFQQFRKAIFQEARKRATYEAVKGNSTTASQLADMFESGGTNNNLGALATAATTGSPSATIQWVGSQLRRLGGLTPKVADEMSKRLMSTSPQQARELVNELMRIETSKVAALQKSQMLQSLLSRQLTTQTVGGFSGSH